MSEEYEIVKHPHLRHFNLFLVTIDYRTPHLHRDFEIDLIVEGNTSFIVNNTSYHLNAGDVFLLNSDQLHEIRTQNGPCTILSLQVSPKFFINSVPQIDTINFDSLLPADSLDPTQQESVRRQLLQLALVYLDKPPYFELKCASILCDMMHLFLSALELHSVSPESRCEAKKRAERIRRIIDYVDDNFTNKTRLQDVAQQEGLTLNYLSHFVRENLNMTFQEYVRSLRLNQAKKLLLSDDRSLLTVSIESGFSDPRYLTKAFLEHEGMTPNEYRKQKQPIAEESVKIHRSSHSSELYYTDEKAKALIQRINEQGFAQSH